VPVTETVVVGPAVDVVPPVTAPGTPESVPPELTDPPATGVPTTPTSDDLLDEDRRH
jgi:hypothetical protein